MNALSSASSSADSAESSHRNDALMDDTMNWRGMMQQLEHAYSVATSPPPRVWKVCDSALPLAPSILAPKTIVFQQPAVPASTIAIRIAECCQKRSIAVEYDDEGAVAHAVTIDRCMFDICLYKGRTGTASAKPNHQGILLEIALISGNPISFHRARVAITKAAQALDSGRDQRKYYQTGTTEYPRLQKPKSILARSRQLHSIAASPAAPNSSSSSGDVVANINEVVAHMEQAFQCLVKDRWDAQILGMESIVTATDEHAVGESFSKLASQFLLKGPEGPGVQSSSSSSSTPSVLRQLSSEIYRILIQRRYPGENSDSTAATNNNNKQAKIAVITGGGNNTRFSRDGTTTINNNTSCHSSAANWQILDDEHAGHLRSLALRIFLQAVRLAHDHHHDSAWNVDPMWVSKPVLEALVQDVGCGIVRPGHVPSRRAGPHDAHLALHILADLAQTVSKPATTWIVPELARAMETAKTTQPFLVETAKRTYAIYTQEEREC
jgi:hypothetical protein